MLVICAKQVQPHVHWEIDGAAQLPRASQLSADKLASPSLRRHVPVSLNPASLHCTPRLDFILGFFFCAVPTTGSAARGHKNPCVHFLRKIIRSCRAGNESGFHCTLHTRGCVSKHCAKGEQVPGLLCTAEHKIE